MRFEVNFDILINNGKHEWTSKEFQRINLWRDSSFG